MSFRLWKQVSVQWTSETSPLTMPENSFLKIDEFQMLFPQGFSCLNKIVLCWATFILLIHDFNTLLIKKI